MAIASMNIDPHLLAIKSSALNMSSWLRREDVWRLELLFFCCFFYKSTEQADVGLYVLGVERRLDPWGPGGSMFRHGAETSTVAHCGLKSRTSATMSPFSACTWATAPRSRITLNTSYTCSRETTVWFQMRKCRFLITILDMLTMSSFVGNPKSSLIATQSRTPTENHQQNHSSRLWLILECFFYFILFYSYFCSIVV